MGGTTAELRASGRLGPGEGGQNGGTGQGNQNVQTGPDMRPLYLRPGFFVICALCFFILTYVGWKRARLPDIPKENAPPEPLYSIDFSHTQVDPDGRVITKKPEQSTAYSEKLGGGARIEMVAINPGVFEMGSLPNEPYYEKLEGPRHPVQVGGFFISWATSAAKRSMASMRFHKASVMSLRVAASSPISSLRSAMSGIR